MTLENKNLWRLRFRVLSFIIAVSVLLSAIYMDIHQIDGKNLASVAPALFAFIGAVFAIDYYTKPQEEIK